MIGVERIPDRQEIETQGIWGKRSRKEVIVVVTAVLIAIAALITVLIVVVGKDDEGVITYSRPVEANITVSSPQEELEILRASFERYPALQGYLETISNDVWDLQGKQDDESMPPEVRAAAWIVHADTVDEYHQLPRRFALATLYYAMGGSRWTRNTGWLTSVSHCEWEGVQCAGEHVFSPGAFKRPVSDVSVLDFHQNNLVGNIPEALVLLDGIQELVWGHNKISGNINSEIFRSMPLLQEIYFQHNELTGTIPDDLFNENRTLDHLFLHGNMLTGALPAVYCEACPTCTENLFKFGLDCKEVACDILACCDPYDVCFD
ncbi:hypothetical protein FisN_10Lh094 [Fistulifera solaris]|uniref:Leucine-rich repeat-containing N-terminal plant-type domain-containing protein n=1 Tax=Fistulifera solaris TaxID=1519565 RepID=A0A1Z5JTH7_FISSO|nr:hypothetical protein FisN_10Lh094 [Fistulifera solaris]|eukprot:GAX17239.1 hypothetical protein FisN_10Lh094 [Fistulifera solaris]